MKIFPLTASLGLLGLMFFITACGEALSGKYSGDAEILPGSTCTQDRADRYSMEAIISRADGEIQVSITRFVVKSSQAADGNTYLLSGIKANASREGTSFNAVDGTFGDGNDNTTFDMQGTMNEAGDEITSLTFTLKTLRSDNTPCRVLMRSDRLILLDG